MIADASGQPLAEVSEYIGEQTNNVAEYAALIFGLEKASGVGDGGIKILSDSELMVQQIRGLYKVKNSGLAPLYDRAKQLLAGFKSFEIRYIPREKNKEADELANRAIDDYLAGKKSIAQIMGQNEQTSLF